MTAIQEPCSPTASDSSAFCEQHKPSLCRSGIRSALPSPCDTCYSRKVCDDHDGICCDWRRWFKSAWHAQKERAARGVAALHLYRSGHNDRQIAEAVGLGATTVRQWRNLNGLPPIGVCDPRPEGDSAP